MKKRSLLALMLALNLLTSAFAQTPTASQQPAATAPASPQQKPSDQEEVVRITTNLVQVDAVVTNKKTGKQVTDLRSEDFEISEDGRAQKLTNFSYVALQPAAMQPVSAATTAAKSSGKNAAPVPPARLRPEQVRRTIALVVDDLGLSFESTAYVRGALKKFVDEQMQAGDLVAVLRTSAGMGSLQQFTSDKRQLYAAIERVRWYPSGRGGVSAFAPINSIDTAAKNGGGNSNSSDSDIEKSNSAREDVESFREQLFAVGTLGAVNFVLRGLRELPGRKSVVLLSDGIKIFNKSGESDRVLEALRRLTDLANRASVVFYTLDARGLQTLGLTAADDTSGLSSDQIEQSMQDRRSDFFESQNGLNYLAQQTGGFFIHNTNDLGRGLRRVLEDQSGYYLIGYRPDESTFDPATGRRKFHRLSLSVRNHPELKVRTRNGFYGVTNEEARPAAPHTRGEQLMTALTSPFSSNEMHLRLTSLFGNDSRAGSFMRSLLYVDGRDLSFTEEPGGWHKVVLDVAAYTFGENGRVIDPLNRTETIRARGDEYQRLLQTGLIYVLNVPIKKPGAYQLRVAVRDAATEHVGSASQFIEVPNLEKNRLALSGIVVRSGSAVEADAAKIKSNNAVAPAQIPASAAAPSTTAAPPNAQTNSVVSNAASNSKNDSTSMAEALAGPGVRRFHANMLFDYGYAIYNAQLDRATRRPQLQRQVRLFHDGQLLFTSDPLPVNLADQSDMKRLNIGGRLQLGSALAPGEYVLQVVVTDLLAKDKYRTATQYIDFEIVK